MPGEAVVTIPVVYVPQDGHATMCAGNFSVGGFPPGACDCGWALERLAEIGGAGGDEPPGEHPATPPESCPPLCPPGSRIATRDEVAAALARVRAAPGFADVMRRLADA